MSRQEGDPKMSAKKILCAAAVAICVLVLSGAADASTSGQGPNMILTGDDILRLRQNITTYDWAKDFFENMKADVDEWRDKDLDIPEKGGGWSHNYIAPDSGRRLQYDRSSPHKHLEPTSGKYYEGELLDAAWREITHKNNINLALNAALLYRLTDDEWYAEFARSVIVRYAKSYHKYPPQGGPAGLGRITAQALGEAVWLISACSTFDLLHGSPVMSDKDEKHITNKLLIPAARHIDLYVFGIHNIQVWESVAMLMAGMIAHNKPIVRKAEEVLLENIEQGIRPEGMWYETSVGYHFYASQPFETLAVLCRNRDLDICDSPNLKRMFTVMTDLAMPDGALPALNDGGRGSTILDNLRPLVVAQYAFGDKSLAPAIAALFKRAGARVKDLKVFSYMDLDDAAPAWSPPERSVHQPGTGLTALRRGGQYALLKYNPPSGGHDHADRLGLIWFAAGRELYPDKGTTAYGHPLYKSWYKTTEAHNTFLVDGKQQNKLECEALDFVETGAFTGVSARCTKLYEGVDAMRAVVLTDHGLIDIMHLTSDTEHTYDWLIHGNVPAPEAEDAFPGISPNPEIKLASSTPLQGEHTISWPMDDTTNISIMLAGHSGDTLYQGTATGFFPDEKMRVMMWRKKGKAAAFAAVSSTEEDVAAAAVASGDIMKISLGEIQIEIDISSGKIR